MNLELTRCCGDGYHEPEGCAVTMYLNCRMCLQWMDCTCYILLPYCL